MPNIYSLYGYYYLSSKFDYKQYLSFTLGLYFEQKRGIHFAGSKDTEKEKE